MKARKRCVQLFLSVALVACIDEAMQQDSYREVITAAWLRVETIVHNTRFCVLTESAERGCTTYGVKIMSPIATKQQ